MAFATNPKIVGPTGGPLPEMVHDLLEANSQSFKKGELVYSNAGAVTACADDAVVLAGIAQADATNVTSGNTEIKIEEIQPYHKVKMLISNAGTPASSSNCTYGKAYGLDVTSNVWSVDYTEVTADACVFKAHCYTPSGAKTNYGIFQFLPAVCQGQTGN